MQIKDLIKRLKGYDPNEDVAYAIWRTEDVDQVILDYYPNHKPLTQEQKEDIIASMDRHHDANIGLNWDVMQFYVSEMISEEEAEEAEKTEKESKKKSKRKAKK